jgi:two-component system sensor histidine kinase KdpD
MTTVREVSRRDRRASDFLELVERARRGRLKIYLGFAAGVGKTYRMLEEAHAMKRRGVDVLLGAIETHGRKETAALLDGLAVAAQRSVTHRGITLTEMDVDAIIARAPQVVIVDEIAHTNVPGSRHNRRFQDVIDIVDAGINVIGAFNIQHLESLNDVIARGTGVRVRETIPDSFLKQADQVVTLDLTVEDLLDRLRSGKIYREDKIEWALAHFFQSRNHAQLRELALREVAESLDRAGSQQQPQSQSSHRSWGGKLLCCLSSSPPHARTLLRRSSRLAGRLSTDWYVVYVVTPKEAPNLIDAAAQRHLLANMELAKELGAEVICLRGENPAAMVLDFARTHGVSDLVIGRAPDSLFWQFFRRSFTIQAIEQSGLFDLHIVSFPDERSSEGSSERISEPSLEQDSLRAKEESL